MRCAAKTSAYANARTAATMANVRGRRNRISRPNPDTPFSTATPLYIHIPPASSVLSHANRVRSSAHRLLALLTLRYSSIDTLLYTLELKYGVAICHRPNQSRSVTADLRSTRLRSFVEVDRQLPARVNRRGLAWYARVLSRARRDYAPAHRGTRFQRRRHRRVLARN